MHSSLCVGWVLDPWAGWHPTGLFLRVPNVSVQTATVSGSIVTTALYLNSQVVVYLYWSFSAVLFRWKVVFVGADRPIIYNSWLYYYASPTPGVSRHVYIMQCGVNYPRGIYPQLSNVLRRYIFYDVRSPRAFASGFSGRYFEELDTNVIKWRRAVLRGVVKPFKPRLPVGRTRVLAACIVTYGITADVRSTSQQGRATLSSAFRAFYAPWRTATQTLIRRILPVRIHGRRQGR